METGMAKRVRPGNKIGNKDVGELPAEVRQDPPPSAPESEPPKPLPLKAVLDDKNVHIGFSRDPEVKGIVVPEHCDLEPGKHIYDEHHKQFLPIIAPRAKDKPIGPPDALTAIALGFIAVRKAGIPLPIETIAWLDSLTKPIPGKSGMDASPNFDLTGRG